MVIFYANLQVFKNTFYPKDFSPFLSKQVSDFFQLNTFIEYESFILN